MNPTAQNQETTRSRSSNGSSSSNAVSASAPVIQDLKADVMKTAADGTEAVRQLLHQTRSGVSHAVDASEEMVRKHPFYTIAGAVAAGAVLGALIARRR